ncbi:hypothetical protein OAL97_02545 [Paracoccaceae bacterium]|nr:hypothetical protein [Paracoccaceae bacterium]
MISQELNDLLTRTGPGSDAGAVMRHGFGRASYGSVVLSQAQSAGADIQLELSIGNYENEPIINYSSGSVFAEIGKSVGRSVG